MRHQTKPVPPVSSTDGLILAFHRNLPGHPVAEQRAITIEKVPTEKYSWTHGIGAETIHTLTAKAAPRPGNHILYLGMDLRILGDSMDDIRAAVKALHAVRVTIIDLSHPDETDIIDMLARAQKAMRWNGDRRQQRRKGARGGNKKAANAEARRNAIMARDAVIRMKYFPKLTLKDCVAILGPMFSEATLRRHY